MKELFKKLNKMSTVELIAGFSGVMIMLMIAVTLGSTFLGMAYDLVLASEAHITEWADKMNVPEYAMTVNVAKSAVFVGGYFTIVELIAVSVMSISKKKKEKLPE